MEVFTLFNAAGGAYSVLNGGHADPVSSAVDGVTVVSGDWSGHYLDADNMPVKIPNAPSPWHIWDHDSKAWQLQDGMLDSIWQQIKAERDRRKLGGTQAGGCWFHSDPDSRVQQIGLVMMGQGMPAGIQWKTMSGQFVEMTPTLASQIFAAAALLDQQLFDAAEQHWQAVQASAEPWTYDYSTGWPQTYEDTHVSGPETNPGE